MTQTDRKFFFIAATGAYRPGAKTGDPIFRRRGLTFFKQQYRPIEFGAHADDNLDADPPLVGPATFAALEAEAKVTAVPPGERSHEGPEQTAPMLIMREATTEEVRRYLEEQKALKPRDPVEEAHERAARAEAKANSLEERLMKLELAQQPVSKPAKGDRS
jgi:hypothetical protein